MILSYPGVLRAFHATDESASEQGIFLGAVFPVRIRSALRFARQLRPIVRSLRRDSFYSFDDRADNATAVLVAFSTERDVFGDADSSMAVIYSLVHAQARHDGWSLLLAPTDLAQLISEAMRAAYRARLVDVVEIARTLAGAMEPIGSPRINPGHRPAARRRRHATRARR